MGVWSSGEKFGKEFKFAYFWHKDGIYGHEIGRNYNENECREGCKRPTIVIFLLLQLFL